MSMKLKLIAGNSTGVILQGIAGEAPGAEGRRVAGSGDPGWGAVCAVRRGVFAPTRSCRERHARGPRHPAKAGGVSHGRPNLDWQRTGDRDPSPSTRRAWRASMVRQMRAFLNRSPVYRQRFAYEIRLQQFRQWRRHMRLALRAIMRSLTAINVRLTSSAEHFYSQWIRSDRRSCGSLSNVFALVEGLLSEAELAAWLTENMPGG